MYHCHFVKLFEEKRRISGDLELTQTKRPQEEQDLKGCPSCWKRKWFNCEWIFKEKDSLDASSGCTATPKAKIVPRGFREVHGLNYFETYASVVKFTSIRSLLEIIGHLELELHQMDVVTAFLFGDWSEDVYMEDPEGTGGKDRKATFWNPIEFCTDWTGATDLEPKHWLTPTTLGAHQ